MGLQELPRVMEASGAGIFQESGLTETHSMLKCHDSQLTPLWVRNLGLQESLGTVGATEHLRECTGSLVPWELALH